VEHVLHRSSSWGHVGNDSTGLPFSAMIGANSFINCPVPDCCLCTTHYVYVRSVCVVCVYRLQAVGTALTDSAQQSISGQKQSAKVEPGYVSL